MLLVIASPAAAADVKLAWDPMPAGEAWTEVRIFEVISYDFVLKATVPATQTTATVQNVSIGTHSYVARSFNGTQESLNSNTASTTILPRPSAPVLRIDVVITVSTP